MKIYVAHPITHGDQFTNCREAIQIADHLMELGYTPFIPHLCALWSMITGRANYEDWMDWDKVWLENCDGLLRINRETPSKGCDLEEGWAKKKGIPVFYSFTELLRYKNAGK